MLAEVRLPVPRGTVYPLYFQAKRRYSRSMEKTLTSTTLGQQAVAWWCPADRDTTGLAEVVDAQLAQAQAAMAQKDWGSYHCLLNQVAISELGYDDETQEEELLGYLDDLCRGYR